jgi:hypothetical protein
VLLIAHFTLCSFDILRLISLFCVHTSSILCFLIQLSLKALLIKHTRLQYCCHSFFPRQSLVFLQRNFLLLCLREFQIVTVTLSGQIQPGGLLSFACGSFWDTAPDMILGTLFRGEASDI